jgi:hypothetical protein
MRTTFVMMIAALSVCELAAVDWTAHGLELSLHVSPEVIEKGQTPTVLVTVSNTTAQTVMVRPIEKQDDRCVLMVMEEGRTITLGPKVLHDLIIEVAEDYIPLAPGKSLSGRLPFEADFSTLSPGAYHVYYIANRNIERSDDKVGVASVASELRIVEDRAIKTTHETTSRLQR